MERRAVAHGQRRELGDALRAASCPQCGMGLSWALDCQHYVVACCGRVWWLLPPERREADGQVTVVRLGITPEGGS